MEKKEEANEKNKIDKFIYIIILCVFRYNTLLKGNINMQNTYSLPTTFRWGWNLPYAPLSESCAKCLFKKRCAKHKHLALEEYLNAGVDMPIEFIEGQQKEALKYFDKLISCNQIFLEGTLKEVEPSQPNPLTDVKKEEFSPLPFSTYTSGKKLELYNCDKCDNKYTKKCSLTRHMRHTHSGTRLTFPCSFPNCSKKYYYSFSARRHEKYQHYGEKKFSTKSQA